ncbi:LPXTG cell wall anchor domain-containing protein [Enterococcus saccharolyticus]|uniref:amidase family protein n=1 Tax=Enterococcus saccharolyticus TaxID=41997 RepID=UPI001E5A5A54|nr:amidase family protein [Enterococcus saccharolyticus]MCD5001636.1 LPXTG cell wall anchor domain-containing protein [Enterococcus saccharolyticus]
MKKLGIKWQRWGMLFATSVLLLPASTAWLDTIDSTTNIEQTTIESVTTSDSFLETESSVETSTTSSSIEAVTVDSTDAATESTVETSEATSMSTSETTSTFTLADYENSSALELAEAIRQKRVTSVQLVQFAFQKIHEQDDTFHAMISLREAEALKEASELEDTGQPFFGVPLIVKGLGHTIAGGSNSNGLTFAKDIVSRSTGSFVKAFQEAGFIVIGQTNYPEMGLKNITNSKLYGPTGSAWNPLYQAGGSSGGSATGVAAGYAPIGSGSDAGGSIRIPASWNGIIGMKPSRGVLVGNSASERGQTSHFAETKTMADTETLFQTFQTQELPQIPLTKDIKIAYSTKSPVGTPVEPEAVQAVETAVAFLRQQGFQVEEVEQPYDGVELMENYYTIGASSMGIIDFLAKQQAKRPVEIDDVDWTTWALFQTSKDLTIDDVNQAWENVRQIGAELATFQEKYPLFLTPTTASTAPLLNDTAMLPEHIEAIKNMESLSKEEKLQLVYDQWLPGLTHTPFTQIANLTGTPAISLPTYVSANGLPLGIQFMAAQNNDYLLLEIGKLFEANQQFNQAATEPVPEEPTDSSSSSTESDSSVETSESSTASTESSSNEETAQTTSNEETVPSSSTEESSSTTTQTSVKEENKQTTPSTSQSTTKETSDKKLPKTGSVRNNLPIIGGLVIVVVVGVVVWRRVRK